MLIPTLCEYTVVYHSTTPPVLLVCGDVPWRLLDKVLNRSGSSSFPFRPGWSNRNYALSTTSFKRQRTCRSNQNATL